MSIFGLFNYHKLFMPDQFLKTGKKKYIKHPKQYLTAHFLAFSVVLPGYN
jgi:hypothetical protein